MDHMVIAAVTTKLFINKKLDNELWHCSTEHAHGVAFLFFSGEYFGFFQQFQAESLTISSPFFIYLHK